MFREVNDATGENSLFTTFKAEFAIDAGDIIFHFYKTPEIRLWSQEIQHRYWIDVFPDALEPAALNHFSVTVESGRLQAQHVFDEEMQTKENEPLDSWWLRAKGFGQLLEPHKFALRFCERLDEALDSALVSRGLTLPVNRT